MERLTKHHVNKKLGAYMACSMACIDDGFDCNNCEKLAEMVDRLAAYEDAMPLERAQELAQAEKDGRLVVLPCNPGQKIWVESCICGMVTSIEAPDIEWIIKNSNLFGEEIFLTREEAEAALKKREAGNEAD